MSSILSKTLISFDKLLSSGPFPNNENFKMGKGTRARRESSSVDEEDSGSDEPKIRTKTSKSRKKSTKQRTDAGPPQRRRPARQTSMPGEYPLGSEDDTPRKSTGRRGGRPQQGSRRAGSDDDEAPQAPTSRRSQKSKAIDQDDQEAAEPAPQSSHSPENDEEVLREVMAKSLQPAEASFEEQMLWAMRMSTAGAETSAGPSSSADADPVYLRKLKESHDDEEALVAKRAKEAEEIRQNDAHFARLLKETQDAVGVSNHTIGNEEDEFEMVLRLSMETAAEDQRKHTSRSWTESNPRAMERGDRPEPSTSSATAPTPIIEPAAEPPKPKSTRSKAPAALKGKKKKTSTLDAVPENAVAAASSSSRPPRSASNSKALAIRKSKPIPEAASQAL
ncbi:MAG: hypothetical protein Q9169_007378, partial [Polycauliona sp. 2 TL-2023]